MDSGPLRPVALRRDAATARRDRVSAAHTGGLLVACVDDAALASRSSKVILSDFLGSLAWRRRRTGYARDMGKLTYVIEQSRKFSDTRYRVVLDGNVVHASHPESADKLVRFENASEKEALATFQKVIQKYFHPRDGWTLKDKKPGVADLTPWGPRPKSKEELETQAKNERRRQMGWAADGGLMVLELKRQKSVNDLEISLDAGAAATSLTILTSSDDEAGAGMSALCSLLVEGAMPKISEVHVECPWVPLARATTIRLTGFAALLEKRRAFRVIGALGDFDLSAAFTQPALTTLRLFPRQLKGGSIERIGRMGAEDLRVLQLGLADDAGTDVAAEAAVFKLPFVHLDELSVCGVVDVAATIQRFVAAGRQLPKHVRLDGGGKDDAALRAALAAWTAKTGSASQLSLGENVLRTIDDKTREALETASVGTFASPFEPQQRDEKVRELWQVLA